MSYSNIIYPSCENSSMNGPLVRDNILDKVSSTIRAAYGFSKIKSSYNGPAIRVINTTTSVQTDIGFDVNGNFDIATAKSLKVNNEVLEILRYYDLNGNGITLFASGSRHILDLNSSRACALTSTSTNPSNGYTSVNTVDLVTPSFFFVAEKYNYGQSVLFDSGGGNQMQTRVSGGTLSVGTKQINFRNGGSPVEFTPGITDGANASDGIYQFTVSSIVGDDSARKNGSNLIIYSGTNGGDTARIGTTLTLCDFAGGGGLGWSGRFYEVIVLDGTIPVSDYNIVESDQRQYFQKGKRIIVFGDSLAYGQTLGNIYTEDYARNLKQRLIENGSDNWDVMNRGSAGDTVENMINTRFNTEILPLYRQSAERNILIINGGVNDIVSASKTPVEVERDIKILSQLAKSFGFQVYIRCLPIQNVWPAYQPVMNTTNVLLAANYLNYADGFFDTRSDSIIGESGNPSNLTYFTDGLHKTSAGYYLEAGYAFSQLI